MPVLDSVCLALAQIAPLKLAESWDNVGLLVGDRTRSIRRVMTCLTITPEVVDEAVEVDADLIVTHHPLPFHPLKRITNDSISGQILLRLIGNQVAVYSAHTAFDSARQGINQMWAERLNLTNVEPLVPLSEPSESQATGDSPPPLITPTTTSDGSGRLGSISRPVTLADLAQQAMASVGAAAPRWVGSGDSPVSKVAVACGSGGSFLAAARRRGCDALVTGEATFHTCLEAAASGIGLVLLGHYWSERFAMEKLAETLAGEFPDCDVWASRREHDPLAAAAPKH